MANNVVGSLLVNLGLETGRLRSDTEKAKRHFDNFERKANNSLRSVRGGIGRMITAVGNLSGVLGVLSVGGMVAFTKSAIDQADEIQKLSLRIGASTEALSQYRHVTDLSGVSFQTFSKSLAFMSNQIADAKQGIGDGQKALRALNLSITDMAELRPEQQFELIADRLNGVENAAQRTQIAMDLFGGRGVELNQIVALGSEGIRAMRMEADDLGLTLDQEAADGAAEAKDALTRLTATGKGLGLVLAKEVGPGIVVVADLLKTAIPEATNLAGQAMNNIGRTILQVWEKFNPSDVTMNFEKVDGKMTETQALLEKHRAAWLSTFGSIDEAAKKTERAQAVLDLPDVGGADPDAKAAERAQAAIDKEAQKNAKLAELTAQREAQELEAQRRLMTANLEQVDLSLMTEEQRLFDSLARRQLIVEEAFENGLINEERHQELILSLDEDFEKKRTDIVKRNMTAREKFAAMSAMRQTAHVVGQAKAMTTGVAQHSRTLFEINKAAGIANAIINTHQAISKAQTDYSPPISFVMMGLAAAAGFAEVQAIRSASFSGGGSSAAPSLAATGGTPSNPVPQTQGATDIDSAREERGSQVTINVEGNLFANDDFRAAMVEALEQAQANDEVRILNAN